MEPQPLSDLLVALGGFGLLLAVFGATITFVVWQKRRARERLEALTTALGMNEADRAIPKPYARHSAWRSGVVDGKDVAIAYVDGSRYAQQATWIDVRVGAGPRRVYGPSGMMMWITIAPRAGRWGGWVGTGPSVTTNDPAFDAEYVTVVVEGFSNFSGAKYTEGPCAIPDAFKRALASAGPDVWFGFDGELARVTFPGWMDDPAPIARFVRELSSMPLAQNVSVGPSPGATHTSSPWAVAMIAVAAVLILSSVGFALALAGR